MRDYIELEQIIKFWSLNYIFVLKIIYVEVENLCISQVGRLHSILQQRQKLGPVAPTVQILHRNYLVYIIFNYILLKHSSI